MKNELKRILSRLVKLETTSGHNPSIDQAYDFIAKELSWYPFIKTIYAKNSVKSVVWSTSKSKHTHVILNAHLDVVPARSSMYKLQVVGNNWIGRGVMDMKFAIAAYIVALKHLYLEKGSLPSLAIMITSDEEVGGANGVGYLVNEIGYTGDIVLIPDGGSNWHVVKSAKGVLQLKVKATGKTSHASEPWGGDSAIDQMVARIARLRTLYPTPSHQTEKTTVVIGTIKGGTQTNQVSSVAEATLDIRYQAQVNPTNVLKEISTIFGENNVELIIQAEPFIADLESPYVRAWIELIGPFQQGELSIAEYGASDGRYFSAKNMPVVVSQPIGGDTHGEGEYINIGSVIDYTNIIIKWLKNIS
ncbi:MAG: M20/M25/M40 family metallo-hydrolase [Microgenomates group bacterium]